MSTIIAEHPNATLARRGYEAFDTGDIETLREILDEDVVWHTPGRSPIAGDYRGRDAVVGQFGRYDAETAGTFRAALQHVLADNGGRVIGIHRNTGQRNGKQLNVYCCLVFEVKNGKLVDGRECFHELDAWDEFWA
jgi:ketosteroid isomerase-like protein